MNRQVFSEKYMGYYYAFIAMVLMVTYMICFMDYAYRNPHGEDVVEMWVIVGAYITLAVTLFNTEVLRRFKWKR